MFDLRNVHVKYVKLYPVDIENMVVETMVKAIRFYGNADICSGKYQDAKLDLLWEHGVHNTRGARD
jgi:hypothetical protein